MNGKTRSFSVSSPKGKSPHIAAEAPRGGSDYSGKRFVIW